MTETLSKLQLRPQQAGYSVILNPEARRTALDGGPGYYRRSQIGASRMVDVVFIVQGGNYQYLSVFYRAENGMDHGGSPFLIDLWLDGTSGPIEYIAFLVPGTWNEANHRGLTIDISAQLEVVPADEDASFDSSLVDVISIYGDPDTVALVIEGLEHLVNVTLPLSAE